MILIGVSGSAVGDPFAWDIVGWKIQVFIALNQEHLPGGVNAQRFNRALWVWRNLFGLWRCHLRARGSHLVNFEALNAPGPYRIAGRKRCLVEDYPMKAWPSTSLSRFWLRTKSFVRLQIRYRFPLSFSEEKPSDRLQGILQLNDSRWI